MTVHENQMGMRKSLHLPNEVLVYMANSCGSDEKNSEKQNC